MVSPIVTKGFGNNQRIVTMGYGGVLAAVAEVIRGAVQHGRRRKEELIEDYENFKITAKLVEINGKELIKPIINTITKTFNLSKQKDVKVEATPEQITFKKDSKFRVWVSRLRIRRKDNETDWFDAWWRKWIKI